MFLCNIVDQACDLEEKNKAPVVHQVIHRSTSLHDIHSNRFPSTENKSNRNIKVNTFPFDKQVHFGLDQTKTIDNGNCDEHSVLLPETSETIEECENESNVKRQCFQRQSSYQPENDSEEQRNVAIGAYGTRCIYRTDQHGDQAVKQNYPIGVKQQHVTDTQENDNDLPCRTKQTHKTIVNLENVRKTNNQSNSRSDKDVEHGINRDKLCDCESGLKCQKYMNDVIEIKNRKPHDRSKCRTIVIWIGIIILATTVATGIVFGLTRLFPIQQRLTTFLPSKTSPMQTASLFIDWTQTGHKDSDQNVNISWYEPKPLHGFLFVDTAGSRVHVAENGTYEFYLTLSIDTGSISRNFSSVNKLVRSLICLKDSSHIENEKCTKQKLIHGTAVSVSVKSIAKLRKGDYIWASVLGINQLYPNNAGNYLTITKYPLAY